MSTAPSCDFHTLYFDSDVLLSIHGQYFGQVQAHEEDDPKQRRDFTQEFLCDRKAITLIEQINRALPEVKGVVIHRNTLIVSVYKTVLFKIIEKTLFRILEDFFQGRCDINLKDDHYQVRTHSSKNPKIHCTK